MLRSTGSISNATVNNELFEQFARIGKALSGARRLEMLGRNALPRSTSW
jgi:hypothetical protein